MYFWFRLSCVLLLAVGASGCFPFFTNGFRMLPGQDWPGNLDSQLTLGANVPIPLVTRPRDAIYMDVGIFFSNNGNLEFGAEMNEYSLGIGYGYTKNNFGASKALWYGAAMGLSYYRAVLKDKLLNTSESAGTVGVYGSVGIFNPEWGGLQARVGWGPDVNLLGQERSMASVMIHYVWGLALTESYWDSQGSD